MAADTFAQEWEVYSRADSSVRFVGTYTADPTGWTLSFAVAAYPGGAALLTIASGSITKAVTGTYTGTFTVPLTAAQLTYDVTTDPLNPVLGLAPGRYHAVLSRTDTGSAKPLASGALTVTVP